MKAGSLFAGIGGFDLGLEWAGIETVWQVEKDEFCQKILAKHWPDVTRYGDIYDFIEEIKKGCVETVDIITGGFPCQPFSAAGQRKGQEDDRYLWPAMVEVVSLLRPAWIVGENVAGILNMGFEDMLSELESQGYRAEPLIIPACAVNAPHRRDRVWIIARSHSGCARPQEHEKQTAGLEQCCEDAPHPPQQLPHGNGKPGPTGREESANSTDANADIQGPQEREGQVPGREGQDSRSVSFRSDGSPWDEPWPAAATRLCSVDDGIPGRLVRPGWRVNALKAAGNAVVPQIPYVIGKYIMDVERIKED